MKMARNGMSETEALALDAIELDLVARTKSEVLDRLAQRAGAAAGRSAGDIARALGDRERLGSTGVGSGVALPHADVRGLERPLTLFARLADPVDWDAIDDRPVDLVVVVLAPALDGRGAPDLLAKFARALRNPSVRRELATCSSPDRIGEIFAPRP